MDIVPISGRELDDRLVGQINLLAEAARREVLPVLHPETLRETRTELVHGWDGDAPLLAVAREGEQVVGFAALSLPTKDNTHLGSLWPVVAPAWRRRGIGSALLDDTIARLRAAGRRTLLVEVADGSAAEAFLRARGLHRASTSVQRSLALDAQDHDLRAVLLAEARAASASYRVEPLPVPVPHELVDHVLAMLAAINDAPTDDLDIEDELFDAERLRGFERGMAMRGRRLHWLVAWDPDGAPAGHTIVTVNEEHPAWGMQLDTSVRREHRGHRLGLRLKLEMLRRLARTEPQLTTVVTWNAASNQHMIAVNERMGHRVESVWHEYQLDLSR